MELFATNHESPLGSQPRRCPCSYLFSSYYVALIPHVIIMLSLMMFLLIRFLKIVLKCCHLGPRIYPRILDPGTSDMSTMSSNVVVPDDIIHHILEYAEVLDVIRARLVRQRTSFSFNPILILHRRIDAFGG